MTRILFAGVALALAVSTASARLGGAGTQFLTVGGGARATSMGGAYTAIGGDLESVFWNPAGIASLEGTATGFTHTALYADMAVEDVAIATPFMDGVIGISGLAFLSGTIEETTEEMPDGTGDTFNANAMAVTLTYARMMTDKFAAGLSLRVIREALAEVSDTNWGFDLGGTYVVGFSNLRLGFSVANFGPDVQFAGQGLEQVWGDPGGEGTQTDDVPAVLQAERFSMPMTFRAGVAYDLFDGPAGCLTLCGEGLHPVDQSELLGLGMQYAFNGSYFLRAGYTTLNNMEWSLGGGVNIPTGGNRLSVDYCYQNHEYLDPVHRLSVGFMPR
ncbi:PorV/PorQ family protein [Candidatus Fermentibacteria bacterium]|nr:PorV/PorQ family protein [Candidatus Fermentibacteria bacterium]